ncbi:hypothetical protein DFQ28_006929 [Apophysomyces sp. BC1034]|nr:hypothetical protein DFQ29_007322 [Apophysomyces sp. BC1021]KAG0187061.1 hypothetical protein DFQ28_006929 [Apophysomyces sp. BC1034]
MVWLGRPPISSVFEYRGKVFSSGADPGEYTIANFLNHYTKQLPAGAPSGVTLPLSRGKDLNQAISGAKVQDLKAEVSRLIRLLSTSHYAGIRNEWKLVTLFIGANNVCLLCTPPMTRLPQLADVEAFEHHTRMALERLRKHVRKSFVNLVGLFNVSSVYEASRGDLYCEFVLDPAHMAICSCLQGNEEQRQASDLVVREYNSRLEKLAKEYQALNDSHFAVVYQPGFTIFPIAKYKQSYFSGIDCFHPNLCANQVMATVLWNNMFSTPQEKLEPYDLETLSFKCPGPDRPYLQ